MEEEQTCIFCQQQEEKGCRVFILLNLTIPVIKDKHNCRVEKSMVPALKPHSPFWHLEKQAVPLGEPQVID